MDVNDLKNVDVNATGNWTFSGGDRFGETLLVCGGIVLGMQLVFCFLGTLLKFEKVKDVAGGLTFIAVALASFFWQTQWKELKVRYP